ncbi:hypothetical protein CFC21_058456 [Triticum aestivum]|uniref:Uncharacterized protein n=2 Tax=Triticum aestivum TaxID=4565 RepID=A0A3B6IVJ5_WHEAT|nr:hypothetical protein CFC21_058456 [Triticum aestivum]
MIELGISNPTRDELGGVRGRHAVTRLYYASAPTDSIALFPSSASPHIVHTHARALVVDPAGHLQTATMALASGFFPPPSYTPGESQRAPFFLGFGGECCNPSFAGYYDYEEYAPSSPSPLTSSKDYTPSTPLQSPEPDFTPSSPDYTPASPDYTPASPDYTPSSPEYTPASPDYTPASPSPSLEYTSSSPVRLAFMMPSPLRGASPDYTPLTPSEHAATSPYYTPLSPPGPGHASSPDYTPSTPPPSPLVVSDAESCASPYYTPSTPSRRAASPDYTPSTPPPSPLASEADSTTSTARCRHHPYQRSGGSWINRGGRQRALGY